MAVLAHVTVSASGHADTELGGRESSSSAVRVEEGFTEEDIAADSEEPSRFNSRPQPPAEAVLNALAQAYPERVSAPVYENSKWTVEIGGEQFFWAEGRMLDAAALAEDDVEFIPYDFRPLPRELPPQRDLTPEELETLSSFINRREEHRDRRNIRFLTALWGMETRADANNSLVYIDFLGYRVPIHEGVVQALVRVEARIRAASDHDSEVKAWLYTIGSIGTFAWRDIAGSANRSSHSFGTAIDILPADYGRFHVYWRWSVDFVDRWWAIPDAERYQFPRAVVTAFEENGFIWGGKWFLFDQMHFEYRPELILIAEQGY